MVTSKLILTKKTTVKGIYVFGDHRPVYCCQCSAHGTKVGMMENKEISAEEFQLFAYSLPQIKKRIHLRSSIGYP